MATEVVFESYLGPPETSRPSILDLDTGMVEPVAQAAIPVLVETVVLGLGEVNLLPLPAAPGLRDQPGQMAILGR